eukprot:3933351-Pyramimonas_sp.AAC.1
MHTPSRSKLCSPASHRTHIETNARAYQPLNASHFAAPTILGITSQITEHSLLFYKLCGKVASNVGRGAHVVYPLRPVYILHRVHITPGDATWLLVCTIKGGISGNRWPPGALLGLVTRHCKMDR